MLTKTNRTIFKKNLQKFYIFMSKSSDLDLDPNPDPDQDSVRYSYSGSDMAKKLRILIHNSVGTGRHCITYLFGLFQLGLVYILPIRQ
jgi:hypothetical protein